MKLRRKIKRWSRRQNRVNSSQLAALNENQQNAGAPQNDGNLQENVENTDLPPIYGIYFLAIF